MARGKAFDPTEALDQAIACFKRHGYHGTSLTLLTETMGIGRASMYATYGDKRSVYLMALGAYIESTTSLIVERLGAAEDPADAIRSLLSDVASLAGSDDGRFGCFMANSAVDLAHDDAEVHALVHAGFTGVEDAFTLALARACELGQLDPDHEPRVLARMFVATIQGIRVIAKANPNPAALLDVVSAACSCFDDVSTRHRRTPHTTRLASK
jgi:TetR/AcrR family transcriptional repressor of nem operon